MALSPVNTLTRSSQSDGLTAPYGQTELCIRPLDAILYHGAATPQSEITRLLNSQVFCKSQNTLKKIKLLLLLYRPKIQQKLYNPSKTHKQTVLKIPKKAHKLHLSALTACPEKGTFHTSGESHHNPFHLSSLITCFLQLVYLPLYWQVGPTPVAEN